MKLHAVAAEQCQSAADAAFRRVGRLLQRRIVLAKACDRTRGPNHVGAPERPQYQAAAARQDGWQHASGRVAYQKKKRLAWRLLDDLQQRVGGIRIEFIDGIDNADPPALNRGGRTEEADGFSRLVHSDDRSHRTLFVGGALKDEETAMGAGRDAATDRMRRIDHEIRRTLNVCRQRIGVAQHEARHPISERSLADALRSADQPGVRNATAPVGIEQRCLRFVMTEQLKVLARMRDRKLVVGPCAHAGLAALSALAVKSRSRKADHTFAATLLASCVASIRTHRSGSLAAICRYASRNCW